MAYTEEEILNKRKLNLLKALGISSGGTFTVETIEKKLNNIGVSGERKLLLDKIMGVAKQLGVMVNLTINDPYLESKKYRGLYRMDTTMVSVELFPNSMLATNYGVQFPELMGDGKVDPVAEQQAFDQMLEADLNEFSKVTVHELLHSTTFYLTFLGRASTNKNFKVGKDLPINQLTKRQRVALDGLERLLKLLKEDPKFQGEYGITSVDEMIAELSNERFVAKLKGKILPTGESFFARVVRYIAELFGVTAYTELHYLLDELLQEPSLTSFMIAKKFAIKITSKESKAASTLAPSVEEPQPKKSIFSTSLGTWDGNKYIRPAGSPSTYFDNEGNPLFPFRIIPYTSEELGVPAEFYRLYKELNNELEEELEVELNNNAS